MALVFIPEKYKENHFNSQFYFENLIDFIINKYQSKYA